MMSTAPRNEFEELRALIAQLRDGQPTSKQAAQLQQMLAENASARRMYARYDALQALLELAIPALEAHRPSDTPPQSPDGSLPATIDEQRSPSFASPLATPVPIYHATGLHGAFGYFSSGWPVAYLIATVIFAIGALLGSVIYVSHPVQVVQQSDSLRSPLSPLPTVVGRITEMVDCVFEKGSGSREQGSDSTVQDSPHSSFPSSLIHLDDKFALASGLMEITYNTGAKVILEGPCSYTVESPAGGYLSVGKITARVEKRGEGRGVGDGKVASGQWLVASNNPPSAIRHSPSSNSQSLIPNPSASLFTITTPTAIVTDLGTEFGVEVDRNGVSQTYVFLGTVAVEGRARQAKGASREVLSAGQAARVEGERIAVIAQPSFAHTFIRGVPHPSTQPTDLVSDDAGQPAYASGWRKALWSGVGWGSAWILDVGDVDRFRIAPSGCIDTHGRSFAIFPGEGPVEGSRVFRFNDRPDRDDMPVGAVFMIDFANGHSVPRQSSDVPGSAGFQLNNSAGEVRFSFYLMAGHSTYTVWDSVGKADDSGIPRTERGLHLELTRTGADTYDLKVVRLEDNQSYTFSRKFFYAPSGSDIKIFRFWSDRSDTPSDPVFFNGIRVVRPPQPADEPPQKAADIDSANKTPFVGRTDPPLLSCH